MSTQEQALTKRLDGDFDPQHPATLEQVGAIAKVLHQSAYFDDLKGASQACVKIIAGKELGIPAIASVREINVFDGNIELSYTMMGSLLRQHEAYDYDIVESSHRRAEIRFTRDGKELGTSVYTIEDAARADLCKIGDDGWPRCRTRSGRKMPWEKYPKAMCLARAMSQGVRTYTPDISHGSIYAEGEISEGPRYVGEARVVDETPDPEPTPPQRPQGDTTPAEPAPEPEPAPVSEEQKEPTWRGEVVSKKQLGALQSIEEKLSNATSYDELFQMEGDLREYAAKKPDAWGQRVIDLIEEEEIVIHDGKGLSYEALEAARNAGGSVLDRHLTLLKNHYKEQGTWDALRWEALPWSVTTHLQATEDQAQAEAITRQALQHCAEGAAEGHYTEQERARAEGIIAEAAYHLHDIDAQALESGTAEDAEGDLFGKPEPTHNDQG